LSFKILYFVFCVSYNDLLLVDSRGICVTLNWFHKFSVPDFNLKVRMQIYLPLQRTSLAPNFLLGKFQICWNSFLHDPFKLHFFLFHDLQREERKWNLCPQVLQIFYYGLYSHQKFILFFKKIKYFHVTCASPTVDSSCWA
jgi:hypothetical protein